MAVFIRFPSAAETHNHVTSAAMFTTLAETVSTTILIAYRIYSASNHILRREKRRFYNILEIVVQSSFIYSLALVANAVIDAIQPNDSNASTMSTASNYVCTILYAVAVRRSRYYLY